MAGGKLQAGKEFEVEMELSTHRRPGSAFLEKLYDILEDERYEEYISWCSDGTSILIKKVEEFSQVFSTTLLHPLYIFVDSPTSILQA